MHNFPLTRSWAGICHITNLILFTLVMLFGPTYQLLAVILLFNSIFFYTFKAEEIRATLLLAGVTQNTEDEDEK